MVRSFEGEARLAEMIVRMVCLSKRDADALVDGTGALAHDSNTREEIPCVGGLQSNFAIGQYLLSAKRGGPAWITARPRGWHLDRDLNPPIRRAQNARVG